MIAMTTNMMTELIPEAYVLRRVEELWRLREPYPSATKTINIRLRSKNGKRKKEAMMHGCQYSSDEEDVERGSGSALQRYEEQMRNEDCWFKANVDRLISKYGRACVCIFEQRVASVGKSVDDVIDEMHRKVGVGSFYIRDLVGEDSGDDDFPLFPAFANEDDKYVD